MSKYDDLFADSGRQLPAQEGASKYDSLFDDPKPVAALAVQSAASIAPDKAAEAAQLARRYNLPPAMAAQFAEDYRSRAKTEDARATLDKAPRLGSWIAERPSRAQLVHDDLDNMGGIEQTIGSIAAYVMGAKPGGGLPGMIGRIPQTVAAGAGPSLGASMYGVASAPFELADQGIQLLDDMAAAITGTGRRQIADTPGMGSLLRGMQKDSSAVAARWRPDMQGLARTEQEVLQGFESFGRNLPSLGLGLMGASSNTVLSLMGASVGGESYGKARDAGASPLRAAGLGAADATAEIVGEKFFGVAGFLKDAKAGMAFGKLFMRDILREVPGEIGTTLWQNMNEWLIMNPDKPVGDWVSEQPDAIRQTIISTIVGAGAQSATVYGVRKAMGEDDRMQAAAVQAEQAAAALDQLQKLGTASKLMARDATTAREFIAQVADENGESPTELFIDGAQLMNTLNQIGMSRAELEAVAPVVAAQLDAAQAGSLVRVPVSEFMAAGEQVTAPLIDHLRVGSEDAATRAESREYLAGAGKALEAEIEAELSKRDEQATFKDSIAAVQARFQADLDGAKRFTPGVNKAYSTLLANFYGATASRLGMTPDQLLDKYQLRTRAENVDGGQTLDQVATDAPDFAKRFAQHGGQGDIDESTDITAKSKTFADMAEAEGWKVNGRGDKYVTLNKDFQVDGETRTAIVKVRISDHSKTNQGVHFGGSDINIAPDDGYPRDTVVQALDKLRRVRVNESLDTVFDAAVGGYVGPMTTFAQGRTATGLDPASQNILNQSAATDEAAQQAQRNLIELKKREKVLERLLECV